MEELASRIHRLEIIASVLGGTLGLLVVSATILFVFANRRLRFSTGAVFRDEEGRDRISIDHDVIRLSFGDCEEHGWATLGLIDDDNPGLVLMDENSRIRLGAGVGSDDQTSFWMTDSKGESRLSATLLKGTGPVLMATDATSATRLRLGIVEGECFLELCDQTGNTWLVAGIGSDGKPSLRMGDESSKMRVVMDTWPSGEPRMFLTNRSGEHEMWVGFNENGEPIWGASGKDEQGLTPESSGEPRTD
ncbi:hypothetical protein [Paludisphaera rhizosphaerae]|uniref:hypothetical protein n=1 Tax=Paludisphaera rhizosphaerae TaxID=2711216 RepID=UPI0013EA4CA0|nr:hypothetical protein [Paludisphaera rhizosphaerae]